MAISDVDRAEAEMRMRARQRQRRTPCAYDHDADRVVVLLDTQVELRFPPALAEGLSGASPDDLSSIEVTPSESGLHFPKLDADLYVRSDVTGFAPGSVAPAGRDAGLLRGRAHAGQGRSAEGVRASKYATEVIDLMAAYPGRGWKMAEIVRHVSCGRELDATERDATRKGVCRVLCELAKGGQVTCSQARTRGAPAEFAWKEVRNPIGMANESRSRVNDVSYI